MSQYSYSASAAGPKELEAYIALFARCFPGATKFSAEYLRWIYRDNPCGAVIGTDAFSDGRLVAHYAIVPVDYKLASGAVSKCALSLNTATDPEHQGKGLFTKLAEATYEQAKTRHGCNAVYGVANANSAPGFLRKLGFTGLGQVRVAVSLHVPRLMLENRVAGPYADRRYLAWRLANPAASYAIVKKGGASTILTKAAGMPFCLGSTQTQELAGSVPMPWRRPILTPHFGIQVPGSLPFPIRFQPSPWHVIVRPLSGDLAGYSDGLSVFGLDMDSF